MESMDVISNQVVSGWLLILSSLLFLPSGILYTGRAIWKWPGAQSRSYLFWERGFVMAAILAAALGLVLLAQQLEDAGDKILAPSGLTLFLIGTVLIIVAETLNLSGHDWAYALVVMFIILAFLGQAVIGASILRTEFLPGWVGWVTVIWSLAWLVILPIARSENMYYPWLHYVAPLIIGIMLLVGG